jgi:protein involved in polysaccharide export with SLBB domain
LLLLLNNLPLCLAQSAEQDPAARPRIFPPTESARDFGPKDTEPVDSYLAVPPTYVLGRGDEIKVTDYSGAEKITQYDTQKASIMVDGTVSIYPVGVIRAAGKTIQQLTALINEKAKQYFYDPKLLVSLERPRPVNVYVLGDVLNPGVYTLGGTAATAPSYNQPPPYQELDATRSQPSLNVITAGEGSDAQAQLASETYTVLSALQRAGGLRDTANVRMIRVTKARTKQVEYVDLWRLLVDGDLAQDVQLEPHDSVFVPAGGQSHYDPRALGRLAANQTRSVRVWGQVKTPGLYQLGPGEDVLSILAKAGGFNPNANKQWVILSRANQDGTVTRTKVSMAESLSKPDAIGRTLVQPGDVVVVANNPVLSIGKPVIKGGIVAAVGILVLFVAARISNVNAQNGNGVAGNTTTRVIAF